MWTTANILLGERVSISSFTLSTTSEQTLTPRVKTYKCIVQHVQHTLYNVQCITHQHTRKNTAVANKTMYLIEYLQNPRGEIHVGLMPENVS